MFFPNAGSHILCSVLELLPAGAAQGQPRARAELPWGQHGGVGQTDGQALRGGPGDLSCPLLGADRKEKLAPEAPWRGLWGCFHDGEK